WDFPPFLRSFDGDEFVTFDVSPAADGTRVHVNYRYAHQEGAPELHTRITLFAQPRCPGSEQTVPVPVSPIVVGGRDFMLSASFAGTVRAEVQPATASKVGPVYPSHTLQIGSRAGCPQRASTSK